MHSTPQTTGVAIMRATGVDITLYATDIDIMRLALILCELGCFAPTMWCRMLSPALSSTGAQKCTHIHMHIHVRIRNLVRQLACETLRLGASLGALFRCTQPRPAQMGYTEGIQVARMIYKS
eukprot:304429-Pyramimonas_sp.AAC.1